jgi:hypothetical protein
MKNLGKYLPINQQFLIVLPWDQAFVIWPVKFVALEQCR